MKIIENFRTYKWTIIIVGYVVILLYPFIVRLIMIISKIDCNILLLLKMPFHEFATPWFTIWSVLGAGVGLYQFQKNMEMSKEHHEDIINAQKN